MIKYIVRNRSGFTLTEVLVAVMVLVVAIVGSTNLLISMMRSNSSNANTLQAYFYTQESLEIFRNMRDTHFFNNVDFRSGGGKSFFSSVSGFSERGPYYVGVNVNPSVLVGRGVISASAPFKLSKNENDSIVKFYRDASSYEDTIFSRKCEVFPYSIDGSRVSDFSMVKVTCTTSWEERSSQRSVSMSMILTDWKDD